MTLDEAMERLAVVEEENHILAEENATLKEELEKYRARNMGGRKKHNAAWKESYDNFAVKYSEGVSIMEIVAEGNISRRTAYRYKAYYDELIKLNEQIKAE